MKKSEKESLDFQKQDPIIEAAFYGNNVVEVKDLKQAYELAKNSLERSLQICQYINQKRLVR